MSQVAAFMLSPFTPELCSVSGFTNHEWLMQSAGSLLFPASLCQPAPAHLGLGCLKFSVNWESAMGWTVAFHLPTFPVPLWKYWPPGPQNVTLFGEGVFKEVIKLKGSQ